MAAKETSIIAGRRLGDTCHHRSPALDQLSQRQPKIRSCASKLREDETFASLANRVVEEYKRNVARES